VKHVTPAAAHDPGMTEAVAEALSGEPVVTAA
jgi:hypothetical protein